MSFHYAVPLGGPPKGDIFVELARGHYHRVATHEKYLVS